MPLDLGAGLWQERLEPRLGPLLVQPVGRRRAGRAERLFQKCGPQPLQAPTPLSVAGLQGLPLSISAKSASRTQITLPS
jgi:hypothetical protein